MDLAPEHDSDEAARWKATKALIDVAPVALGEYFSFIIRRSPRRLLHMLSYYKFAAKMIGANKRVVEVGCSEGLGTVLLAESAQHVMGLDLDAAAIASAKANFASDVLHFEVADVLQTPPASCDAVVTLDVIEHIYAEHENAFMTSLVGPLVDNGILIIGTPNIESDRFASAFSRSGHVNLFSAERLRTLCERSFHNVFMFSGNDEMVHTGFSPMAHYLLALCVGPRRPE